MSFYMFVSNKFSFIGKLIYQTIHLIFLMAWIEHREGKGSLMNKMVKAKHRKALRIVWKTANAQHMFVNRQPANRNHWNSQSNMTWLRSFILFCWIITRRESSLLVSISVSCVVLQVFLSISRRRPQSDLLGTSNVGYPVFLVWLNISSFTATFLVWPYFTVLLYFRPVQNKSLA